MRADLTESVTEGWFAVQHFTDRFAAIRRFAAYLNEDPPAPTVLFFHGDGGNGKSLLLRFLRDVCCKRFDAETWEYLASLPPDVFRDHLEGAEDVTAIPAASIDFALGTEDVLGLLQELRRGLARHGLRFPVFNYACVHYWRQAGLLTKDLLRQAYPDEELRFAAGLAEALSESVPFGRVVYFAVRMVAERSLGPWFDHYLHTRGLDEALVNTIARLDYRTELVEKLPLLFAEDLNTAMQLPGAPPRVVLFFDTYERFWGDQRTFNPHRHFGRDEWFRRLLSHLDRRAGIVTVVAGREPPRWADLPDTAVTEVELHAVNDFSDADAADYLECLGLGGTELTPWLLDLARVGPDRVHPYLLGLVTDAALAAARADIPFSATEVETEHILANKGLLLVRRFLRYVDDETAYAVRALAACRSFTFETYCYLGQEQGYSATRPRFDLLTTFSFVRRAPGADPPRFSLHDLLRRLLHDLGDEATRTAHAAMEAFYREPAQEGDARAQAEAIYHANQIDWERGLREWTSTFESALRSSQLDLCRALVDLHQDLALPTSDWRGRVTYWIGQFETRIARYAQADAAYRQAITFFEEALTVNPGDAAAQRGRGAALHALGSLCARLGRHDEARSFLADAVTAFDKALQQAPDDIIALSQKGATLQSLGVFLADLGQVGEATRIYRASIEAFEAGLRRDPGSVALLNNKAGALLALGLLEAAQGQLVTAVSDYRSAIATLDAALTRTPDYVYALINKGNALAALGDAEQQRGRRDEALISYRAGVAAYDEALRLAPDSTAALNNKGNALQSIGALTASSGNIDDAIAAYRAAAATYEEALIRAPGYTYAQVNRAETLTELATLSLNRGDLDTAERDCRASLASYDDALHLAPAMLDALVGKAEALEVLALILLARGGACDADEPTKHLRAARALMQQALAAAPGRPDLQAVHERIVARLPSETMELELKGMKT